jgi:sporulation protein YlmC with PRC-barrel domain
MAESMQFTIGAEARCQDGACGTISRVVVDPIARVVTHLAVVPRHHEGDGRLVPVTLVDSSSDGVSLRCTMAEFEKLDAAEETRFLPGASGYEGYSAGQVLAWPYFGLGGGMGLGMGMGGENMPTTVTYDAVPLGEVAVRRGEHVHATDGDIGRVQGLVIDARNHHVTHVLLQEGHIWGRKEVAIPIGAVTGVEGGIHLDITKQQVQDLPAVEVDHPEA